MEDPSSKGAATALSNRRHSTAKSTTAKLQKIQSLVEQGKIPTLEPVLSILFNLKGSPYSLDEHFHFSQMFNLHRPATATYKCGRQIGKSQSVAADGLVTMAAFPQFSVLFVTPLFEQIRRFSTLYVRKMIQESNFRDIWLGTNTEKSVLQRTFKNGSQAVFSFAGSDANRIRGFSANETYLDEIQDMDWRLLPIIKECMAWDKKYEIARHFGTSKVTNDALAKEWSVSSQAEWWIPCTHCSQPHGRTWNIPSSDYHIERMLGPAHKGISPECPGLICYRCEKSIYSRLGHWEHRYKERRWTHAGYHIPQPIVPLHYESYRKWATLLAKRSNPVAFFNEVLGEAMDAGQRLITQQELRNAGRLPWKNNPNHPDQQVLERLGGYRMRVLAVDWGGGGKDGISTTVLTLLGLCPDGRIECLWGKRMMGIDHAGEARECLKWFQTFQCNFLAHDYTGAGSVRETILRLAGIPDDRIIPVNYVRSGTQDMVTINAPTQEHHREYWSVDKSRSLGTTVSMIRTGLLQFFQYDHVPEEDAGLMEDFSRLIENRAKIEKFGSNYLVISDCTGPDDFAQSVNIGCVAIWELGQAYPDFASALGLRLDPNMFRFLQAPPEDPFGYDWTELDARGY